MNTEDLLKTKNIDSTQSVIQLSKTEALQNFNEAMQNCNLKFDFSKLSKKELETLFKIYGETIILYHPEAYHQELAAFFEAKDIFKKHGLSEEEISLFDFA